MLLLAQRKLTYTTAANQAQQSVLLPATSSQCMLEPYGHMTGAVTDVDKTPLVWQQRLATSPDALQNNVDMQGHANSLSQVCPQLLLESYYHVFLLSVPLLYHSMGQIIKSVVVCLSVYVCMCLWARLLSHFSTNLHEIWQEPLDSV